MCFLGGRKSEDECYDLPRQEATYGGRAWIIHWLLWWFVFHFFKWWDLVTILPISGLTVFLAHRTRKTCVAIVEHFLFNLFSLIPLVVALLK